MRHSAVQFDIDDLVDNAKKSRIKDPKIAEPTLLYSEVKNLFKVR